MSLLLALLSSLIAGCREHKRPNVVLIVVDALRADHLSAFGYERATSPYLDALMGKGTLFTHAVSPSSHTVPVIASVLTGLYPSETSVHYYEDKRSFDGVHPSNELGPHIDRSLELLSERLRALGYETSAVVANPWIREEFGFGQGFDEFIPLDYGDGKDVVDTGLHLIEKRTTDEPFFLYLHFMDIHYPYRKPGVTKGIYLKEKERQDFYRNGPTPPMTPRDLDDMRALYDEGILYVDAQIERLAARLDELSPPEQTLLVIISDHGDEFDEHGGLGHGTTLYGELVSSFLFLRYPPLLPAQRIETPVSLVDLAPTILALVAGDDRASARSVLEQREDGASWLLSELGRIKFVQRDGWKLILDIESGEPELYHLPTDPGETENIAAMNPKITREWMRYLSRFVAGAKAPFPDVPNEPVNEELREKLRTLGYVE